ncbi:hypothetical protein LEP1GSC060_3777 [Leptospira weilii serovar Ranarum str. ICFT]|uniref:Uncharacterized protein n=1 Tax=Leptospira weilii serovar Ranarum str. ICFT TaxID=1218598 RepID=N1WMZ4_9LEPT|nr:hypothetical protein [Leptospira weilii]EMY78489.1 hypothetical protein LEP1GSC060_3777 [Leptospira weilii serovar Ranarum str. ICFT]
MRQKEFLHPGKGALKSGKTFSVLAVLLYGAFLEFPHPAFSQNVSQNESANPHEQAETKPLLRVFPSYRKEECDWAIRPDICVGCLKIGRRYAQKIHFYPSGLYREHGCYSEEEGFFLLETSK